MRRGGTWQDPEGREWPDEDPKNLQTLIMPHVDAELRAANERRLAALRKKQQREDRVICLEFTLIFTIVVAVVVIL